MWPVSEQHLLVRWLIVVRRVLFELKRNENLSFGVFFQTTERHVGSFLGCKINAVSWFFLVLRSEILVHCSSQRVYFRQKLPIDKIRGYQTSPAVYSRNAHFAADTNHNTCAFLTEFSRRWMHPLLYRVSGNHRNHCKPFRTNLSTLVYLQMDHYNSWRLNSSLTPSIIIIIIKL